MSDVIYCGKTIDGPKVARNVVLWRKQCRQRVRRDGDRCRFHGGPRNQTNTGRTAGMTQELLDLGEIEARAKNPQVTYKENVEQDIPVLVAECYRLRRLLEPNEEVRFLRVAFEGEEAVVQANAAGEDIARLLGLLMYEIGNGTGMGWQAITLHAAQFAEQMEQVGGQG